MFFAGVSVRQDSGHWIDEFLPAHAWCQAKTFKCRWDRTFILCTAKQESECQMKKSKPSFAEKQTSSEKSLVFGQIYCSKKVKSPMWG